MTEKISWERAREANKLNWEDRVPIHEASYGLEDFDDPKFISNVILEDLPVLKNFLPSTGLNGLDVCHLQCHLGTDTVSLARLGANAVGVDFSPSSLKVARELADKHHDKARFVEADVLEVSSALTEQFDLVYTSIGTVVWLDDLTRWAQQIALLLRDGGLFFMRDIHPMMMTLDEAAGELVVRDRYFGNGLADALEVATTYSGTGTLAHTQNYQYPHALSEILTALLNAGLKLELFDEGKTLPSKLSDLMTWSDDARAYVWADEALRDEVPLTYTIVASKN